MSQPASHPSAFEIAPVGPCAPGPSESASAIEHQAALDASLIRREREAKELVLELDAGELRLRRSRA